MKDSILSLELQKKITADSYFDNPYRLSQILDFIYNKKVFDFSKMTNLPKAIRQNLEDNYSILNIQTANKKISIDGTVKFLFKLNDDNYIESVILKDNNDRYTFCISTQSGCKMSCDFCATGKMGFKKNLDYTEIISQILLLSGEIKKSFNIVFMGMGEPLDNFDNLIKSIDILTGKNGFNLSPARITVSTCGLADKIIPLLELYPNINLACSLNSAIQSKREKIMPIAKKFNLDVLFNTLDRAIKKFKCRITLEYVLIKDFNTGDDDIKAFDIIKNKKNYLINIIPQNGAVKIEEYVIKNFINKLTDSGFNVTRRYRRGEDIQADCGQLYWESI